MSKLKEKELLEIFEKAFGEIISHRIFGDSLMRYRDVYDQAYQQIKEMIQKEAERDEIEASYIDIVIDLYDQLEEKKPKVTEEFVKEYAEMIDTAPHHCTRENLIGMLREAGVKVTID